ncbi:hypothetical protein BC833DRAFT_161868 [Globomyces pollinis-pini]|nr:hypothetical protein BC833DRAFT_161868 [Globomyces pollinis-pini]
MYSFKFLLITASTLASVIPELNHTTIDFTSNYNTKISGPLIEGESAIIRYDLSRAKCPHAISHATDTWGVYAFVAFNNDFSNTKSYAIANHPSMGSPQIDYQPLVELKRGDMAVWIMCSSELGTTYDSDYGRNFHFNVL